MNEYSGYTRPVPGGHWAMLRFAKDGQPKPIMGRGQKPVVFPTELEATKAVLKATFAYFNGDYRRDGVTITAVSKADATFPDLKPLYRNGRKIEREVRRASA